MICHILAHDLPYDAYLNINADFDIYELSSAI